MTIRPHWSHLWPIALLLALPSTSRSDPASSKPQPTPLAVGVFTVKSILGVNPSKDQIRLGESGNWGMAFAKCPESYHQPALRVGDPRMTTSKEKMAPSGALVDVTTMEMDFECGSCGGKTCPSNQYCVEMTITAGDVQKSCETKLPAQPAFSCSAPIDQHVRCTAVTPKKH